MEDQRTSLRVSRREFLSYSALFATGIIVSACAPSVATAPTAPAQTPAAAPTNAPVAPTAAATATVGPRKGGVLTWGQWDANSSIDPATSSGASATEIIGNVLDPVVAMDADQKFYPVLASKWDMSGDGKKFTFTLRDGVKFHDGALLTSDAVKRSWDRILDPRTKAAGVVTLLGPIDKIEAPDPKTVIVTMKEPFPLFLQNLWRPYFGILSPKLLDSLKPGDQVTNLVGSGPFKFANRSADGVVTVEANPDYAWGSELLKNRQVPYLQSVKFRSITEGATRVATLESGENLMIDELPEPDYNRLKDDKRFRFVLTPRRSHALGFFINIKNPPTDDLAVRQAMNWAVDRKSIVDKLFFGVDKVAVGPLSEGVWARLDDLEKSYGYDPKKAQQILDDAGWKVGSGGIREKGGKRLAVVLVNFRSPWSDMATVVQSQFREIGIDVQAQNMERNAYLDFVRSGKHNMCASAGTGIDPDILRVYYLSGQASNFSFLADPQVDAMLTQGAQQAIGSAERRKTYEDLQRKLVDILPFVSIMSQVRIEATAAKVHDLKMGPEGLNALPMTDTWMDA
jgi:peptide/nickel transport system substrate-binding protein